MGCFSRKREQQGTSSIPSKPTCNICMEPKSKKNFFSTKACIHSYCSQCVAAYITSKIQDNVTSIKCPNPNCSVIFEPELCKPILTQEVFDRWMCVMCEAMFIGDKRFYCPFKDCSGILYDDGEIIQEAECPHCRRLFCVQCKVPWHSEITCKKFRELNPGEDDRDGEFRKFAKHKKWQMCPKCKFYVEKSFGCMKVKCRCGLVFCYNCGVPMDDANHFCIRSIPVFSEVSETVLYGLNLFIATARDLMNIGTS